MRLLVIRQNQQTSAGIQLLIKAKSKIGTDASPANKAPNDLSCAESVSTIIHEIDPRVPIILGTANLDTYLQNSLFFIPVKNPLPGDVINYPTGYGNGKIENGHIGILGDGNRLLSSNPRKKGIFDDYWTLDAIQQYLGIQGGFPRHCYRKII